MKDNKPKDFFEAQENLNQSFKQIAEELDKSFHITPFLLGLNTQVTFIQRKISTYKFKRFSKVMSKKIGNILKGKQS